MENIKLLNALESCEDKLVTAMVSSDVTNPGYHLMAETLSHIRGLAQLIAVNPQNEPYRVVYDMRANRIVEDKPDCTPATAPKVVGAMPEEMHELVAEDAAAKAEPEPPKQEIKPCPKPEPQLTKQDMVRELTYYSNEKGVDVAAVMGGMGYTKLSDIPQSKYAELLDAVKKAAGEQ